MLVQILAQVILFLTEVLIWSVIIQGLLSLLFAFKVVHRGNPFWQQLDLFLYTITEPIFRSLRRIIPPVGMVDLAPMAAIILIIILQIIVRNVAHIAG